MADAHDALLNQVGERLNVNVGQHAIRQNLLKFVGEEQRKRVEASREAGSQIEEVQLEPLDPDEQELCQVQIKEMHPLYDTPFHEAFPVLCCCLRVCSGDKQGRTSKRLQELIRKNNKRLDDTIAAANCDPYQGTSYKKDMAKKFGISFTDEAKKKTLATKAEAGDDDGGGPFAEYGFGIKAWINTLRYLFLLYLVLSVFAFVIMSIYSGFDGLEPPSGLLASLAKYSLGNMGFAQSLCFFQYATIEQPLELKCYKGTLSNLKHSGATAYSAEQSLKMKKGNEMVGHDFCGDPKELTPEADCSQWLDLAAMQKDFEDPKGANCKDQKSCKLKLSSYFKKVQGKKEKGKDNEFFKGIPANAPESCYHKFTQAYVQVHCDLTESDTKTAQQTACMVIFLGMLMSLKYTLALDYWQKMQVFRYKKWDVDTNTPADYSIKMKITEKQYKNYLKRVENDGETRKLDELIVEKLQNTVKNLDAVLDDPDDRSVPRKKRVNAEINVASIYFGFKNGDVIRMLKERGTIIGNAQFHEIEKVDIKLNDYIDHYREELKEPVCAFITFTEQEAYERCEEYLFKKLTTDGSYNPAYKSLDFLGDETIIEAAPEPSNIIWEHLEVTPLKRRGRRFCVNLLITLFIFLTFLLYSGLKSKAGENKLKYPSTTDCAAFNSLFKKAGTDEIDVDEFKKYAIYDKDLTVKFRGAGYYLCYCKLHSDPVKVFKAKDHKAELCYQYQKDKYKGLALTNFVTVLVSIMNIVIRKLNIFLIEFIGYDTFSKQTSDVMSTVFWATFVNTGIILLMTNAELRYSVLRMFPLHQQYPDFNENWYEEIGPQLIKTMTVMAFYPYLELFIFGGLKLLFIILDKGCCCWEKNRTKTTTPYKYINMYAGPEYLMHFKYSSILTQVCISFMYGLFIPALFPIATLGILNMYLVEKGAILYYYRKPPMYDDKLQKDSIKILQKAPILMFIMGYWALGNTQVFFGEKAYRNHNNNVVDPQHPLIDHGHGLNQTHWIFMMVFCYFVKKFIFDTIRKCINWIRKTCCGEQVKEDVLGEDITELIGNYWDSMTGDDQKIWYATECYYKDNYDITSVSAEAIDKLRTRDRRKAPKIDGKKAKIMDGDSKYDLLASIPYQQAFQFISIEQRNQYQDHVLSDMIMRALNLDDDKDQEGNIFEGSYLLLKEQALGDRDDKLKEHKSSKVADDNEGGESDSFYRFQP